MSGLRDLTAHGIVLDHDFPIGASDQLVVIKIQAVQSRVVNPRNAENMAG